MYEDLYTLKKLQTLGCLDLYLIGSNDTLSASSYQLSRMRCAYEGFLQKKLLTNQEVHPCPYASQDKDRKFSQIELVTELDTSLDRQLNHFIDGMVLGLDRHKTTSVSASVSWTGEICTLYLSTTLHRLWYESWTYGRSTSDRCMGARLLGAFVVLKRRLQMHTRPLSLYFMQSWALRPVPVIAD